MQFSFKAAVAAAVALALGSASALAVEGNGATNGNSSLIVNVYDSVLGISIVQDLGLNYADFLESAVTPDAGLTLSYSVDLSIFAGSDPDNVKWSVYAADAQGNYTATEVLTTAALDLGDFPGTNGNIVAALGSSGMQSVFNQWNASCTGSDTCTGTGFSSTYFGEYGEDYNNAFTIPVSGSLDTALGFYSLKRTAVTAQEPLLSTQYANSGSLAQWLLSSDGTLTYSVAPVPLPAALWLLLSGLAGVGVIGRRKTAA